MSKSLGNIISVREFLREFSSEALRLFVLQTHYRSPVDYSRDKVAASEVAVQRLRNFRSELARALSSAGEVGGHVVRGVFEELRQSFFDVMDDDFNTPKAVAALFDAVRQANAVLAEGRESRDSIAVALAVFDELTVVFGFSFSSAELELTREEKELLEERGRLRALRKWAEADKMRDMLLARGLRLVDKSDGTTSVART
jgi:cysteinyl-tRNA synthetase